MPICKGCGEEINIGTVLKALGGEWHPTCFKCCECQKPITGGSFAVKDDKPMCAKCAGEGSGPAQADSVCVMCKQPFSDGSYISVPNFGLMHADCFKCAACGKVIDGSKGFVTQDGKPYHGECAKSGTAAGSPCAVCGKALTGTCVTANGKSYHKECFICSGCKGDVSQGFFNSAKGPLCAKCKDDKPNVVDNTPLDIRPKSNVSSPNKADGEDKAKKAALAEMRQVNRGGHAFGGGNGDSSSNTPAAEAPAPVAAAAPAAGKPKFCGECGAKVTGNGKFCGECGHKF